MDRKQSAKDPFLTPSTLSFLAQVRELHDKAKKGLLTEPERLDYERGRRELGRLILVAQQVGHAGQTLRARLRVAHLAKVELGDTPERASTLDVATGGFAVLVPAPRRIGQVTKFALWLPSFSGGNQEIRGTVRVASSRPHGTGYRVSFAFVEIGSEAQSHLDMVIFDWILAKLPSG
jgi:hypothetical protein